MKAQSGVDATRILQNAKHTLFVEGKDGQQIDPLVMKQLLVSNELTSVEVQPLGACDNVRSAAQALILQHPSYYFLIDRDDQNHETVEQSWNAFPDPAKHNMLIWRKRELENYFIDPEYLSKSKFLKPGVDLRLEILADCSKRLFLDCANLTLLAISRELNRPLAISHFANPNHFTDRHAGEAALGRLTPQLENRKDENGAALDSSHVNQLYCIFVDELSGGLPALQYASGTWLERMSGKEIFNNIANRCFTVSDNEGKLLIGKEKSKAIATDLVRLPLDQQPSDFRDIVDLLRIRLKE